MKFGGSVEITPPDIGVELMVAPVHLEYLGSIENIAAAKAELIEGLKPGGTAVLNADDEWVIKMRDKHRGPHDYVWHRARIRCDGHRDRDRATGSGNVSAEDTAG